MIRKYISERTILLFLAVTVFSVYANSLGNGFTLDDTSVIINNPVLKGSISSLFSSIDTNSETQLLPFYRPVTYLTYLIEGRVHGFNPFLIRLFNVLLHTANTLLVFKLARSLYKEDIYAPLLAALLFAVHPLQSEGVDFNAGGRNTMLACLFSLSAYLLHNRSIIRRTLWPACTGAALLLVGMFSKETALMTLPFIAALEYSSQRCTNGGSRLKSLLRLFPYAAATAVYVVMRWLTLSKLGIQTSILPGFGTQQLESLYVVSDVGARLLNNLYIIPRYLLTVLWPTALAPRYVIPEDLYEISLLLALAWVCIVCISIYLATKGRTRATVFGVAWLTFFWLPVSGIVVVPGAPLADRFLYLPAVGLWIVISDQIMRISAAISPAARRYGAYAIAVVLTVLALLTVRRNLDWRNNITLFSRFSAQYSENVHARAGLGMAYFMRNQENDREQAELEFEKVVGLDPFFPKVHTFLGVIKLDKGDYTGAHRHFEEALAIYPYDGVARINRGITNEKLGRKNEALMDYIYFLSMPGGNRNTISRKRAEDRVRELSK